MDLQTLQEVKPLSKDLELALTDCYNREQQHIKPVVACAYNTNYELIQRGMLSAKTFIKNRKIYLVCM